MSKEKTVTFTGEPRKPGVARDPDIAVVTCALTGVLANRKQCPHIPYTPAEIGAVSPTTLLPETPQP